MKITTFNPLIISPNADAIISLFEELGFEKRHAPVVNRGNGSVQRTRMKDSNGFYVDISQVDSLPRDMTAMRMNVDSIDEAFELLTSRGFKLAPGTEETDPKNARAMLMVSPSGFAIEIIEHVK